MPVNLDKPQQWKDDILRSVDMYNDWFIKFAPEAFRNTRIQTTKDVETALRWTDNVTNIKPQVLREHPEVLPTLRMSTCPPLAVDRLIGLAGVFPTIVKSMELRKALPPRSDAAHIVLEGVIGGPSLIPTRAYRVKAGNVLGSGIRGRESRFAKQVLQTVSQVVVCEPPLPSLRAPHSLGNDAVPYLPSFVTGDRYTSIEHYLFFGCLVLGHSSRNDIFI